MELSKAIFKRRNAKIVRLRFENGLPMKEIGLLVGVSRERVRQILMREKGTTGEALKNGPTYPELYGEDFWEGRSRQTTCEIAAETGYTVAMIQRARLIMGFSPSQLKEKDAALGVKRCGGYFNDGRRGNEACGEVKRLDQFYSDRGRADGKNPRCKSCVSRYQKRQRESKAS